MRNISFSRLRFFFALLRRRRRRHTEADATEKKLRQSRPVRAVTNLPLSNQRLCRASAAPRARCP